MQDNLDTKISTRVDKAKLFEPKEGDTPKVRDVPMITALRVMAVIAFIATILPVVMLLIAFDFVYIMFVMITFMFGMLFLGLAQIIEFLYLLMLNRAKKQTKS